ncbi:glycosyltransferase [Candidatus Woesearchaeota archaeon]|nr:glycosyltransferase [Candidatus Woesearchaeota archaeon]
MNIVVVTDTFLPEINGATIALYRQYNELAEKHHILIICPSYPHHNNSLTKKMKLHENITVMRLPSWSLPSYPEVRIVIPQPRKIKKMMNKFNAEVIHIHTPGALGSYMFFKKLPIKKIATFHTLVTEQLQYVLLSKRFFESLIWKLLIKLYNKADIIITPTETIKKVIVEKGIIKPITVISNGIVRFKTKKEYTNKNKLVYVGRVSYEKNIDVLIKAVALIKKKIPNITLTIIGDGPDIKRLEKMTKELNLRKHIFFKSWMDNDKLNDELMHYDIFVTASIMETQGIAILEAMSVGLPIIGAEKYAIPELIKNNGYVFEPHNVEACAETIIKCLQKDNLQELGKNSIKIAKEHSIDKTLEKLEKLYREQCLC